MKTILITGGTGSWGQELTRQLLKQDNIKEIRIYSRGELAQVNMARKLNNSKIKFIIGDIFNYTRLNNAMKNVDIIYHLAALKHVPVCEDNQEECINTNILGVQNVIESSINNNINLVVDVSTDKACNPFNTYGASKSIGEKLIIQANMRTSNTKFVCIRAGNVIGSNGSIIPFFIEKAKNKKPLPITSYDMTRYLMTIPDAIKLVLKSGNNAQGGEIFVTRMPAANILDLAATIWKFYNDDEITDEDCNKYFPEVGIRPGEKLHEMLVSEHEALYTVEDNDYRIILPMNGSLDSKYKDFIKMTDLQYTSNDKLMSPKEIKEMLIESGFLK